MSWGYLGQFWDSVASTTINAWEYTADWFQNIGNAVAGAIGGMFDWFLHYINDLWILIGWLAASIAKFFVLLWSPLDYIFNFFTGFTGTAFNPATTTAMWSFSTSSLSSLSAIPYFDTLKTGVGIIILACILFFLLKFLINNFR